MALGLMAAGSAAAQTPIVVGQSQCGFSRGGGGPLDCYNVNMTIGGQAGTAWVSNSFITFRSPLEGANTVVAQITNKQLVFNNIGLMVQETVSYMVTADPDNNGDSDTLTGSITINVTYGPPGRYGMRTVTVTGGSGAQSIAVD